MGLFEKSIFDYETNPDYPCYYKLLLEEVLFLLVSFLFLSIAERGFQVSFTEKIIHIDFMKRPHIITYIITLCIYGIVDSLIYF